VKILLDECVDRRFARDLVGHEVATVPRGKAGLALRMVNSLFSPRKNSMRSSLSIENWRRNKT